MTIRVLLVDDHDLLRAGLATVLALDPAIEVAGECRDGVTAARLAAELIPDLVLMDIEMPCGNGITATADDRAAQPHHESDDPDHVRPG